MCNVGLLLLTTSATSLDQFYQPNNELSTNITLESLNTHMFQMPNFLVESTEGYKPKSTILFMGRRKWRRKTTHSTRTILFRKHKNIHIRRKNNKRQPRTNRRIKMGKPIL